MDICTLHAHKKNDADGLLAFMINIYPIYKHKLRYERSYQKYAYAI